jgi:membrane-bound lytic murein transglycosylase B
MGETKRRRGMKSVMSTLFLVVFFVNVLYAHTPEERQADLVHELKEHFDPQWIDDIFNHQNMCRGHEVPQEKIKGWWQLESRIMSDLSLERGEAFFLSNEKVLRDASVSFDDCEDLPYVILSILRIESDFGENRTGIPVIQTLFDKYQRVQDGKSGDKKRTKIFSRAVIPFLRLAEENEWNVCEIRGSRAAAFGYPQFIPESLSLAVDGDNDERVDIVGSLSDASYSISNYLVKNDYPRDHRLALFRYNHDWRYVDIVWRYAMAIKGLIKQHSGT